MRDKVCPACRFKLKCQQDCRICLALVLSDVATTKEGGISDNSIEAGIAPIKHLGEFNLPMEGMNPLLSFG